MSKYLGLSAFIVGILFTGCGDGGEDTTFHKPHNFLQRGVKSKRVNEYSVNIKIDSNSIVTTFSNNQNGVKHSIYYMNVDNDANTGLSVDDYIVGADYMIEDQYVYKLLSKDSWDWEYVGEFNNINYSNNKIVRKNPDFDISSVFGETEFTTLIEFYNTDWEGDYPTIFGAVVHVGDGNDNEGKVVTRDELLRMIANNEDYSKVDVSQIKYFNSLFEEKDVVYDITGWDVSGAINMGNMFMYSENFNQDISNWNVSNVRYMYSMFEGAEKFNQPIGKWNVSNLITMNGMFLHAEKFNQPLNNWNTSNIISLSDTFSGAFSFNQPLDNWDTTNVETMYATFENAKNFNQDISNWNISKVEDHGAFSWGSKIINTPFDPWYPYN